MPYDADILISGASFAGLALASALSAALRGEARIAIVDRADAGGGAADDIRASAVALGSVRILQAIGVWRHVADLAQPVTAIDITDGHLDAMANWVICRTS